MNVVDLKRRAIAEAFAKAGPELGADPDATEIELHNSDLGNALLLIRDHGENFRRVETFNQWFIWSSRHWARDTTSQMFRLARRTIAELGREALRYDGDERRKLLKHVIKSESAKGLGAMVSLAGKIDARISVTHDTFDQDGFLLNVLNGTLDLRTGELREHRRGDYLTHCLKIEYDPGAPCPRWTAFLERILPDPGLRGFVQRMVGYSLTADTSEQVFALLYGTGQNGKSVFLETLQEMLGPLAQAARFETFLVKRGEGIPNDVARMYGVRFITAIETEDGRRLDEAMIKQLTGGDTVTARFMRAEFFDFVPSAKLWLAANHRPVIRGTDFAIWRRVKLIPFEVTIPAAERDRGLKGKLRRELPGILAWAVEGCRSLRESGLGTCEAVEAHTLAYRDEQDILAQFVEDECSIDPRAEIAKADLYKRYTTWAERNGEHRPLSQRTFSQRMSSRYPGLTERKVMSKRLWMGIS